MIAWRETLHRSVPLKRHVVARIHVGWMNYQARGTGCLKTIAGCAQKGIREFSNDSCTVLRSH